jgi:hypothetical protein
MTKSSILLLTLAISVFTCNNAMATGAQCPGWFSGDTSGLAECPPGNLVPETYPAAAVAMSDEFTSGRSPKFMVEFAKKVIQAGIESDGKIPALLISAGDDSIAQLKAEIDKMSLSPKDKAKALAAITQVRSKGFPWQQDYFQSQIDPATGTPVLRDVEDYGSLYKDLYGKNAGAWLTPEDYGANALAKPLKGCGYATGEKVLQPQVLDKYKSFEGSELKDKVRPGSMGGNVLALPGGGCAIGADHFNEDKLLRQFSKQLCDSKNLYKIRNNWLNSGHSDELVKVINNPNAKAPCDFSIVLASPAKAKEVLGTHPQDAFINPSAPVGADQEGDYYLGSRELDGLCKDIQAIDEKSPKPIQDQQERGTSRLLFDLGEKSAQAYDPNAAGGLIDGAIEGVKARFTRGKKCRTITNAKVLSLLNTKTRLAKLNDLVQKEMDSTKKDLQREISKSLPKCESVDFIDAPYIFGSIAAEDQSMMEPNGRDLRKKVAKSILPNPTNAVMLGKTLISPDPLNKAFRDYMNVEYKKRGLKNEIMNTMKEGHLGNGNLHCLTHTIHVCKPRQSK